jgi:hypothetical protein
MHKRTNSGTAVGHGVIVMHLVTVVGRWTRVTILVDVWTLRARVSIAKVIFAACAMWTNPSEMKCGRIFAHSNVTMNEHEIYMHVAWRKHGRLRTDPLPCTMPQLNTCIGAIIKTADNKHVWAWECMHAVCPLEDCYRRKMYWKTLQEMTRYQPRISPDNDFE